MKYLEAEPRVLEFVSRLLRLAEKLEGHSTGAFQEALRRQERRVRDATRLRGLGKALLDQCDVRPPEGAARAEAVRHALFSARGRRWPPQPGDRNEPYASAARELGLSADEVRRDLFADRPEARTVLSTPRLEAEDFLDRYNFELARAVLLDALEMTVTARTGWRRIFRAVKLAGLMYEVTGRGPRYTLRLTGPASEHIARPQRYGVRMARVVPALAQSRDWRLDAVIVRDGKRLSYRLDRNAPFAGRARRVAFDSGWERVFAKDFGKLLEDERDGWSLHREVTPVPLGDTVLLPDFTLRHRDGREALVEIVGFWTPEYVETKLQKVRDAARANLILVVYRGLAVGPTDMVELSGPVVWFRDRPRIKPVLEVADAVGSRE